MEITLAKSAGFCFGVNRAVNMVFELLQKGERVCTLGPIIHNPQLTQELAEKGVRIVDAPGEVKPGEILVIRSHGVPEAVVEEIAAQGLPYADATCPFVGKIHRLVREHSDAGELVIIAGNPQHPEVEGIRGCCKGPCVTFESLAELTRLTEENPDFTRKNVAVVAQTTFSNAEWQKCIVFIKKVYTNAFIFDTICDATSIRQKEATELAQRSDLMIVIGGRQSSNTAKLLQICSQYCPSYLVETASELPFRELARAGKVGVTAGASTPARIIKEVLKTMAEQNSSENEMSFEEALNQSFKTINSGERVKGVVVGVNATEVLVDIGTKHQGYIPAAELTSDSSQKPTDLVKVGDELDLVAMRVNDLEGTVMLSKRRVDAIKGWDDIVKASDDDEILDGTVTDIIKGGVLAACKGTRVFIPASQTGVGKEGSLDTLKNKPVKFKIIDLNTQRKRAVGSIRAANKEARKEAEDKFWATAEVGQKLSGTVKSLTSYGAFVDVGGVDGMIHISELSWSRIKHPSEVVKVGDVVNVTIKALDNEKHKISLSYDDKGQDPWEKFLEEFHVGDIVDAKVVSMMPFGAFAQIMPDVDGLIHISQISEQRIAKPQDALNIGDEVKVKITGIDTDRKRISLSMKEAADEMETEHYTADENGVVASSSSDDESNDQLGENAAPEAAEEQPKAAPADELGENA